MVVRRAPVAAVWRHSTGALAFLRLNQMSSLSGSMVQPERCQSASYGWYFGLYAARTTTVQRKVLSAPSRFEAQAIQYVRVSNTPFAKAQGPGHRGVGRAREYCSGGRRCVARISNYDHGSSSRCEHALPRRPGQVTNSRGVADSVPWRHAASARWRAARLSLKTKPIDNPR